MPRDSKTSSPPPAGSAASFLLRSFRPWLRRASPARTTRQHARSLTQATATAAQPQDTSLQTPGRVAVRSQSNQTHGQACPQVLPRRLFPSAKPFLAPVMSPEERCKGVMGTIKQGEPLERSGSAAASMRRRLSYPQHCLHLDSCQLCVCTMAAAARPSM